MKPSMCKKKEKKKKKQEVYKTSYSSAPTYVELGDSSLLISSHWLTAELEIVGDSALQPHISSQYACQTAKGLHYITYYIYGIIEDKSNYRANNR
jgi:hypothetical protein